MIRLTIKYTGDAWYVNPNHIVDILNRKQGDNSSLVTTIKDELTVVESPEEVVRKVLEWKLAMVDYRDTVRGYRQMARQALEELAGLHVKKLDALVDGIIKRMEEPNHDAG